jgi:hypothetical protein
MQIIDPERIRLVPGQSLQAMFEPRSEAPEQIGLFVRATSEFDASGTKREVEQRAGLIQFNDVLLVLTMIKVDGLTDELFDVWWNYHAPDGTAYFRQMADQERLTVHFYDENGRRFSLDTENSFRKFFNDVRALLAKTEPWTEVEFDRALRGFCARSYPKENLWQMIEMRAQAEGRSGPPTRTGRVEDYPGSIPVELHQFYTYLPDRGHCIQVIPSPLEESAMEGNPEDYLYPAPVKTVLRCGIRWTRGFPVAPIPYIPDHGLAVPPEDTEL